MTDTATSEVVTPDTQPEKRASKRASVKTDEPAKFDQKLANETFKELRAVFYFEDGKVRPMLHFVRLGISKKVGFLSRSAMEAGCKAMSLDTPKVLAMYDICADATKQKNAFTLSLKNGTTIVSSIADAMDMAINGKLPKDTTTNVDEAIHNGTIN